MLHARSAARRNPHFASINSQPQVAHRGIQPVNSRYYVETIETLTPLPLIDSHTCLTPVTLTACTTLSTAAPHSSGQDPQLRARLFEIASRITRSGGWIFDVINNTLIWSDAMCALHEVPPGKAPAPADVLRFNPPEFHALIRERLSECIQHGTSFDLELQIITTSGRRLWVRCLGDAVRDCAGRTVLIEGALQDISEKKAYEETIRASEQRFVSVADATTDAVWDWDVEMDTIWWNSRVQNVFGFSPKEAAHDSAAWLQHVHPNDRARVHEKILSTMKGSADNWSDEYQSLRRDGTYATVSDHALLIRDDTGRVKRIVGGITDLSQRRQLERDLERLNRALRMLTACNELLIRATDERDLLTAVCELIIAVGGYSMAYVGFAIHDASCTILPIAHAGEPGYLNSLNLSWSEKEQFGRGPAGRTIRDGAPTFVNDILIDEAFAPWRDNAIHHGFRAVINLPLKDQGHTFGLLALFSEKVLAVGDEEINLLQQMANDVAFGIGNLRAQAAQRNADARIREQASLLDKARDAILVCGPDQCVRFWNKGAERLYGFTPEQAIGRSIHTLIYAASTDFFAATEHVLREGEWNGELVQQRRDGSLLTAECRWTRVVDEHTQQASILSIHTDVSQRKAAAQEIEQLAFYDQLTGLPNRQLLVERLAQSHLHSQRTGLIGALLFIDLDNFKTLNDTLGHARGDQLLQVVSSRLLHCVREEDTVARFGGDEFVVSLVALDTDIERARAKAALVGEKILEAMRQPIQLSDHEHQGSCSIGIAMRDKHDDTVDDLLKRADLAMYRAKAAGRNALEVFAPAMQTQVNARAENEADLRRAVMQEEFLLHYQPQLGADGRVTGAEALVRWQHPQRGMVSPMEFIFLAEETGLIYRIGKWVLETACRQLAQWMHNAKRQAVAGLQGPNAGLMVSVNVSVQQFRHPDFVEQVMSAVAASGIDPRNLKLELTESLLVDDVEATVSKMTALKAIGIAFSLDDFGTGYSSLAYLKRLPLDELKIDQSFVRDVLTDPNDAAIARTIVALAQSLGLSVIAEGVETAAQRAFLAEHGCNAYQGYLFSRPLPAAEFEQFVLENTGINIAS